MNSLDSVFSMPGPEWRGKPFWSWNGRLDEAELLRQLQVVREMGLGGVFMHSRTGLETEYLGDEWFRLTNACADEAERLGLEAWLYDEDRWPSGTAGGLVTQNPAFRMRFLSLRVCAPEKYVPSSEYVAVFTCHLEADGRTCHDLQRVSPEASLDATANVRWNAVLVFAEEEMETSSFYNGATYVDTLNREATEDFIRRTHERYRAECGPRLGTSVRGIFTDEPHRGPVMNGFSLSVPHRRNLTPWTAALPEEFARRFGYDLIERLPELFLQPNGKIVSPVKWHYMELLQQLFLQNFVRPLYDWCDAHGMQLTGHALHEDNLTAQAAMQGSLMRFYEYQHVPGIDLLTEGNRNYWIAKQLQSAARQLGHRWLLSELYGCTGWQMDFQSHKEVGDWQALFGINVRCHHLSWYTMVGEAKRDYPASILHQSAWWKDYHYVETYFARLGLLLSQGEPVCDVLVLNSIESLWCQVHVGWADGLAPLSEPIQRLEQLYAELFYFLIGEHIDFDYGDEEMLGRLGAVERDAAGEPVLRLGKARYRTVIVGGMTTIRSSSVALLCAFLAAGGRVVFAGDAPAYVDAEPSSGAVALSAVGTSVPWESVAIAAACRTASSMIAQLIDAETGAPIRDIFCQYRRDGDRLFLIALNVNREKAYSKVTVRLTGAAGYADVTEWDCREGEKSPVAATESGDGYIVFETGFPVSGERVFSLERWPQDRPPQPPNNGGSTGFTVPDTASKTPPIIGGLGGQIPGPYAFTLSEPNVCVLDVAGWRLRDEPWQGPSEVLRVDQALRDAMGWAHRSGDMVQPWFRERFLETRVSAPSASVALSFAFEVAVIPEGPIFLCVERPDAWIVTVNGQELPTGEPEGFWVDIAFAKLALPPELLRAGENEIRLEGAFSEASGIDAIYLLGDFGVRLERDGTWPVVTELPSGLMPGDVTAQGLPFYGGAIRYHLEVPAAGARGVSEKALLVLPEWEAACARIGERYIAFAPHVADVTSYLSADPNSASRLELEVVLTRRNTFGPLHERPLQAFAYGPGNFVTRGDAWSDRYQLWPAGLLAAPEIHFRRDE